MFRAVIAFALFILPAASQATLWFADDIPINGMQEVPQVPDVGNGRYNLSFDEGSGELCWEINFDGLTGTATAMHFHAAPVGSNGSVEVNVGGISGLIPPSIGCATLTPTQGATMLSGDWYLNVHTAANPGGEIRGQTIGMIDADAGIQTDPRNTTGGQISQITGGLDASEGDHTDCYCISVDNPSEFYVTNDPGIDPLASSEVADSRLWLWNFDGDQILSGNDDSPDHPGLFSVVADANGPIAYPTAPINPVTASLKAGDGVLACMSYFDNTPVDAIGTPLVDFGTAFEALNGPDPSAGPFVSYTDPGSDGPTAYSLALAGANSCEARFERANNPSFDRSIEFWDFSGGSVQWSPNEGNLTPDGAAEYDGPFATITASQCLDARYIDENALLQMTASVKPADLSFFDFHIFLRVFATSNCTGLAGQMDLGDVASAYPINQWTHGTKLVEFQDIIASHSGATSVASIAVMYLMQSAASEATFVDDMSTQNVRIFRSSFD